MNINLKKKFQFVCNCKYMNIYFKKDIYKHTISIFLSKFSKKILM